MISAKHIRKVSLFRPSLLRTRTSSDRARLDGEAINSGVRSQNGGTDLTSRSIQTVCAPWLRGSRHLHSPQLISLSTVFLACHISGHRPCVGSIGSSCHPYLLKSRFRKRACPTLLRSPKKISQFQRCRQAPVYHCIACRYYEQYCTHVRTKHFSMNKNLSGAAAKMFVSIGAPTT